MDEKTSLLLKRTKQFALRVIKLSRSLPRNAEGHVLGKQLLRSGTSVGANYRAACNSRSKAEFISKMSVVVEEADETVYWIELLIEAETVKPSRLKPLLQESLELARIFSASRRTAKNAE